MTISELASVLRERYDKAPHRDRAAHVVLFAIEFADELECQSTAEIANLAGIGKWGPQISLGRKLARFVQIKK